MATPDRLSSQYWDKHSTIDGCSPQGFQPRAWRSIFRTYPFQRGAVEGFLGRTQKPTEVIIDGDVDPRELPFGAVLRFEEEVMVVERQREILGILLASVTRRLWQTNFPWGNPEYRQTTSLAVVADLERFREENIRGLVVFNEDSILRSGSSYQPSGIPRTQMLRVGRVTHSKLMEGLQANDRQIFERITKVELFK